MQADTERMLTMTLCLLCNSYAEAMQVRLASRTPEVHRAGDLVGRLCWQFGGPKRIDTVTQAQYSTSASVQVLYGSSNHLPGPGSCLCRKCPQ